MNDGFSFRTLRLTGRAPDPLALGLYKRLFRESGEGDLERDMQDWGRHQIAPWTLSHAGNDVGVGGFRLGFGDDGLEVLFHFLPDMWGQGLASEFLLAAMDHARGTLKEHRFFGRVSGGSDSSKRVMEKAGFRAEAQNADGQLLMRLG
ncbi:GNAT family N-acetyltransferase [Gymnodinialimonas hymeniacidonis]|uniref:GNAT family N-acetyltransferase n=1 Tax=Gymnodinialimonas hymeniacidonis TaxID=3126508 RepID=UPI0034C5F978